MFGARHLYARPEGAAAHLRFDLSIGVDLVATANGSFSTDRRSASPPGTEHGLAFYVLRGTPAEKI
jgi:hypothetical protein